MLIRFVIDGNGLLWFSCRFLAYFSIEKPMHQQYHINIVLNKFYIHTSYNTQANLMRFYWLSNLSTWAFVVHFSVIRIDSEMFSFEFVMNLFDLQFRKLVSLENPTISYPQIWFVTTGDFSTFCMIFWIQIIRLI